jgi:hypothetical protein
MPILTAPDIADEDRLLVQQHVGSALRCMYENTISEPLPDRMMALLEDLAVQESRRGQTTNGTRL